MSGAIDTDRVESMSVDDAWTAVETGVNYVSWLAKEFLYTGVSREDLVAEGRLGLVLNMVRGVMAYVSGRIAKLSPDSIRLETPAAVVGVRGTTLALRVVPE